MAIPRAFTYVRLSLRLLFFAVFLLAAILVWPQTFDRIPGNSPSFARVSDSPIYTLQGTVLNSVTNQPVGHALVQVFGQTPRNVFSDSGGHFQFPNLPQMQTTINVIKPGFLQEGKGDTGGKIAQINVGPQISPVIVKLIPEAEIRGKITDKAGEPLDGVPVNLYFFLDQNGVQKKHLYRPTTQTDDAGEFQFTGLPGGDYLLAAGPSWKDLSDPYAPGSLTPFVYPQSFFPGVQKAEAGTVIHISTAQHARANFALPSGRTFAVSGSLVGGSPRNSFLQFVNTSGQEISIVQRREGLEGFRARLSAGPALIKAHSTDQQGNHFYGQSEVDVSSDLRGLRIAMEQVEIPVIVQRESSPAPNEERDAPPSLNLISLDPAHPDTSSQVTGEPGNWNHSINNIEFGRYRVQVNVTPQWYAESVTYGGVNLISEPLVVGPGGSQSIQIRLVRRTK
ncbi:MAG: hypothetical protein JWO13_2785 [Acidobacteriales bacterium]|nr:hypothetical protein [Terriglobales bacterium]